MNTRYTIDQITISVSGGYYKVQRPPFNSCPLFVRPGTTVMKPDGTPKEPFNVDGYWTTDQRNLSRADRLRHIWSFADEDSALRLTELLNQPIEVNPQVNEPITAIDQAIRKAKDHKVQRWFILYARYEYEPCGYKLYHYEGSTDDHRTLFPIHHQFAESLEVFKGRDDVRQWTNIGNPNVDFAIAGTNELEVYKLMLEAFMRVADQLEPH